jgi:SAM-dependent methyltransferase
VAKNIGYFDCYTKRPSGEAARLAELVYQERWRMLDSSKRVLDVGFGGGGFIDAAPAGIAVCGVDTDPAAVAARPERTVLASAEDLPFGEDTFDAVHAAHVVEHLEHPDRMVAECARVLEPGGRLLVVTPDIERYGFRFWVDHTHVRPFTAPGLVRLLQMHGFEIQRVTHGLFHQTRLEEGLAKYFGVTVERRYAVRARLGRRFGGELVVLGRLR